MCVLCVCQDQADPQNMSRSDQCFDDSTVECSIQPCPQQLQKGPEPSSESSFVVLTQSSSSLSVLSLSLSLSLCLFAQISR